MPDQTSDALVGPMVEMPRVPIMTYNFADQIKYLHDGRFADFEIKCGSHVFKAHRFIICSQSPFFRALAGGEFKEATEQATSLPDEEPALLARYLIYLYSSSYPEEGVGVSGSQFHDVEDGYAASDHDVQACMLHARMYCFAKRRCDERLEQYSLQEFSRRFWAKKPRQALDKHNLIPRGPTRTLKYHMGKYTRDMEETLIVGTKNTHAEVFDLLSDFAAWGDIKITQKRVRGNDAFGPAPPVYRRGRVGNDVWQDCMVSLADFDFDHQHLIVERSVHSNAKNLALLSSVKRWQSRAMSAEEQDLTRYILNVTTEYGSHLKDLLELDLIMRKNSGSLIPDPAYRALQLEFAEFFLTIDSLVKPSESRQCKTCLSIQPVIRQACSCGKWSDSCDKDCLSKEVQGLRCFCCMEVGQMQPLEDRDRSVHSNGAARDEFGFQPPVAVYIDDSDVSDY